MVRNRVRVRITIRVTIRVRIRVRIRIRITVTIRANSNPNYNPNPNPVVLNLGSIEPQGFGESVSGVRRRSRHTHTLCVFPFRSPHSYDS